MGFVGPRVTCRLTRVLQRTRKLRFLAAEQQSR